MIEPQLTLPGVEVYIGDAKETVMKLAEKYAKKVSSVMCSPPYLWKRAYLPQDHPSKINEIGQEPSPEEFVDNLCDLFDAIRKYLLREDGSIWANLADTWSGSGGAGGDYNEGGLREGQAKWKPGKSRIPRKSLMFIPERFAIEMVNRGWICRNKPIWFKGKDVDDAPDEGESIALTSNGMPISAEDRLKETWEQWYHFVKSNKPVRWIHQRIGRVVLKKPRQEYEVGDDGRKRPLWVGDDYFYDLDSVRVQMIKGQSGSTITEGKTALNGLRRVGQGERIDNPLGRNPGDMFFCPITPFPLAHFACYPPAIVEIPAKTTCPEAVCQKCGTPRQAIYETKEIARARPYRNSDGRHPRREVSPGQMDASDKTGLNVIKNARIIGYTDCGCNAGWEGGIVLDPFFGSGSTAQGVFEARLPVTIDGHYCQPLVIGIDLDERNLSIIEKRLTGRAKQSRKIDYKQYGGGLFELLKDDAR